MINIPSDENNEAYPGWGYYAQLLPADYYGKVGTEVYCGTIFEKTLDR